MFLKESINE